LKEKKLRQKGFSKKLNQRLRKRFVKNERLNQLTDNDVDDFIQEFWIELADLLKQDFRVFFEGRISFFRKAIKRRCFNMQTKKEWFSYKMRVRSNVLEHFRDDAESEITIEEYYQLTNKKNKQG
jgi:hypothetical protein